MILRPEQARFRRSLRGRYGERCQISGYAVMEVVQACHLRRVADGGNDDADNGLLLRSDIHVLFDADLIGIEPGTFLVHVSPMLDGTPYAELAGLELLGGPHRPNERYMRWTAFNARLAERQLPAV